LADTEMVMSQCVW